MNCRCSSTQILLQKHSVSLRPVHMNSCTKRFSHSVYRQPYGRSERKVHPVGGGAHEGRCHYMRRTKPPVGWEHVKNCFPVPNELLDFDLPGGSIAVYIFLLRHADRRTGQCHPSTATMAKNLHYCRNTVASYVRLLEERGLIVTEHTKIITKNGIKKMEICSTR